MPRAARARMILAVAVIAAITVTAREADAQSNPYELVGNWAQLPAGRTFGSVIGAGVDPAGNVWVFDRCGTESCADSDLAPILQFDASGRLLESFGAELFVFPHGFYLYRDGIIWTS